MKYEFNLDDYWSILDEIEEREDVESKGFEQIKIAEKDKTELYVYGYRIYIPELDLTIREGAEYFKDHNDCENDEMAPIESIVLYEGDENNPLNYHVSYCNSFLPSIIQMIAKEKGKNTNPKCYIDDAEFKFWD